MARKKPSKDRKGVFSPKPFAEIRGRPARCFAYHHALFALRSSIEGIKHGRSQAIEARQGAPTAPRRLFTALVDTRNALRSSGLSKAHPMGGRRKAGCLPGACRPGFAPPVTVISRALRSSGPISQGRSAMTSLISENAKIGRSNTAFEYIPCSDSRAPREGRFSLTNQALRIENRLRCHRDLNCETIESISDFVSGTSIRYPCPSRLGPMHNIRGAKANRHRPTSGRKPFGASVGQVRCALSNHRSPVGRGGGP